MRWVAFTSLLRTVVIVDDVSHKLLKRLEPHPKYAAKLAESVDVAGIIVHVLLGEVSTQCFGEMITILCEWIIVAPVPEFSKKGDDIIHVVLAVVGHTDGQSFFQNEAGRVTLLDNNDAGMLLVVTAVRKLAVEDADRGMI